MHPSLRGSVVGAAVPFLLAVLAGALAPTVPAAEQIFTPQLVANLRAVSSARISPAGSHIAYTLAVPRRPIEEPSGGSWSELHVIFPNGASRPFVMGEVNVGQIEWLPDQSGISFLAKRGKDKFRSLWTIPVDGGEARNALSFTSDIQAVAWSPDGKRVAFIADDPVPEERKKLAEQGFDRIVYEEELPRRRVHIAAIGDPAGTPRALDLPGYPSELHWSPAGDRLVLALAPTPLVDDDYMRRRIRIVDVASGSVTGAVENPGKLGEIAWSPDGEHIAYIAGEDEHDPSAGRLLVAAAGGGQPLELMEGFEGEFADIAWKDGETILYLASVGVWTVLGEIRRDGTGNRVRIPAGRVVLSDLSVSRDGRTLAALGESPLYPPEVHALSDTNELPLRLTDSNPSLAGLRFAPQEVVSHKARDGLALDGVLVRPLGAEEGKRYPLILCVHGGPEAHVQNGWQTSYSRPGQTAAARGYAVFYPNYRGSTGRGVAFSKLGQADYAGKEFDDLVDAVDHLVSTGLVDGSKVGITGGSYGGYASAWGATYLSERFAASVMFVGISDLISKTGTTDIPREMFLVHARKDVHDHWQWFLERSPIYHARKSRTPTLILHGADDPRVHPSQSLELYRQLKTVGGAPVRLVLYPGEGHGNRKSAARLDYNVRMLQWFDHYLKGPGGSPPPSEVPYASPEAAGGT